MALGINAVVTASNQVRVGTNAITSIGGFVGWSNISDGRVKKNIKQNVLGLTFINKLNPVTYNLNLDAADKISQTTEIQDATGQALKLSTEELAARKEKEQIIYTGFIAQEVEKAAKSLNYDFSGIDAAKNNKDLYGLRYAEFVVPLVKAVQELSQENDELKKQNNELEKRVEKLEALLNSNLTSANRQLSNNSSGALEQNIPNPFNKNTVIKYNIPAQAKTAAITISSNDGQLLKTISIAAKGAGQLSLNAGDLAAGIYYYTLIIDGTKTGSKKMIVIK